MGTFTVAIRVCKPGRRPRWAAFDKVMVDTGSEATWLPEADLRSIGIELFKSAQRFVMANGTQVTRDVGIAVIQAGDFKTVDEVAFARPGDLLLLGARTIEGFNATIDARKRKLLPAGPIPAALGRRRGMTSKDPGVTERGANRRNEG